MLGRVIANEIIREAKSGRTKPVLMLCETDTDGAIEVVLQALGGLFRGRDESGQGSRGGLPRDRSEFARALPRGDSFGPGLGRDGP